MNNISPKKYYQYQLDQCLSKVNKLEKQDALIAFGRGVVFLGVIAIAVGIWHYQNLAMMWLIFPVGIFVGLMVLHNKVIKHKKLAQDTGTYYQTGLQRLDNHWQDIESIGERYLNHNHAYSSDLDIFGQGSLFQLINFSQTRLGEDRLASWLAELSDVESIIKRQEAVKELSTHVTLFENVALLYSELNKEFNQGQLETWSQQPSHPFSSGLRWIAGVIGTLMFTSVSCLLFLQLESRLPSLMVLISIVLALVMAFFYRQRIRDIMVESDKASSGLDVLSKVMLLIEQQQFQTEMLQGLRQRLETEGLPPSQQIGQLRRHIQNLNNATRNQFFAPIAFALCLPIHFIHALEVWRSDVGIHVPEWLAAVADFEALLSLARYAYEHPDDVYPELLESGTCFAAQDLGHPLVDNSICVRNDITLDKNHRLIMISGSNMSGKSTLLRTLGCNAVLAYAGAPVRASRMEISPLVIGTAMRVQDSLQDGRSLFYAVLSRLKLVIGFAGNSIPLLFLLDEILHGTNSHDRRVGAEGIINGLLAKNAIGLVTTHDLELTKIVSQLSDQAINIHFQDEITAGQMTFDYKVYPGVVKKSNALELMRILGLEF